MRTYILCFLVIFAIAEAKKSLPPYIKPCQRNSNISECIARNLEAARPYLAKGIPRLSIPPLNPLVIPSVTAVLDNFTLTLNNFKFYNVDQLQLRDIELDLDEGVFKTKILFPYLNATAQYVMEGSLFGFELDGENFGDGHGSDLLLALKLKGTPRRKGDKDYMFFKKVDFEVLSVAYGYVNFENVVRGNPELSKAANEIINRNMRTFVGILTPLFDSVFGAVFAQTVRNIFMKFPLEQLFPVK